MKLGKIFSSLGFFFVTLAFGSTLLATDGSIVPLSSAILALVFWFLWGATEFKLVTKFFQKRSTKYGMNSVFTSAFVLAFLGAINFIAIKNNKKKDITRDQSNSLSVQSQQVVKALTGSIKVFIFAQAGQEAESVDMLKKYQYYTDKIKYEVIDPYKDPIKTKEMKVTRAPTLVFTNEQGRETRVESITAPKFEEQVTNALINLKRTNKKKVYFLTGHGEKDFNSSEENGLSSVAEGMKNSSYEALSLSLLENSEIPADCEVLVIAGINRSFFEHELKMINTYLTEKAGKVFLMIDPDAPEQMSSFLSSYGIKWRKNTVVENNPLNRMMGASPLMPIVQDYGTHAIINGFKERTIFQMATALEKTTPAPAGLTVDELIKTGQATWGEIGEVKGAVQYNEGQDIKGPMSLGYAVKGPSTAAAAATPAADADSKEEKKDNKSEYHLIVIGNSAFATNNMTRYYGNSDLFLNVISFLAKDNELISIRPKPTDAAKLEITEQQAKVIRSTTGILLPFFLGAFGIGMWIRRRRL